MTATPALALRGISKHLGTTRALDDAHCIVRRGTVHALLGENGAGKTTLMRIAFGALAPDAGTVALDGREVRFTSTRDAIAARIGMVHQHFTLVPAFTVAENVALAGRGPLDLAAVAARVRTLGTATGLVVDPESRVRDLGVGAQQRTEILKALANDADLLILDEPTAVLSPAESAELARWVRAFADRGGTVVLITHRLAEAMALADDITVLRRGRTVLARARAELTAAMLVEALVGEVPERTAPRTARTPGDGVVFALDNVGVTDARGVHRLREVNLTVRRGEVLGVLGVEGSGQHELLRVLAGRLAPTSGHATLPLRVGFVPEDRLHDALIPEMTLTENYVLAGAATLRGSIDWAAERERTAAVIAAHDVVTTGPQGIAASLSGGNQQKFVVGRERAVAPRALVAENPTRGLDLRAAARVLDAIAAVADTHDGAAVLFSSDLDEILSLTTRVVVCFGGRVTEVAPPADPADRTQYARALVGLDA